MRFAVFGTGGAGGYYGARLALAGEDVTFIARGEHLRVIREHGLRVDSVKGDFVLQSAQATNNPGQVGTVDVVILGVKAWQVPEAAEAMGPLLGPESVVVPLQNGVETPDQLAAVLGREHVFGGLAKIFSSIIGRGTFIMLVDPPPSLLANWTTVRVNVLKICLGFLPERELGRIYLQIFTWPCGRSCCL